jgi:hypothetical protein
MKMLAWAAALVVGALVTALLGLSILAASQTTSRAATSLAPWRLLMYAELKAVSLPEPTQMSPESLNVPCLQGQHLNVSGNRSTGETPLFLVNDDAAYRRTIARQARCLHRHGFLSTSDVASIVDSKRSRNTHGLGSVVPLSLQIIPSTLPLTAWSVLLAVELVGTLLFIRYLRRQRRQPTSLTG